MSLLPQIGLFELMVLAVLALVVVGPKDLPKLMRGVGNFLRQARAMADEFRAGFDEMAKESEMAELRREIEDLKQNNPVTEVKKAFDDTAKQASSSLNEPAKAAQGDPFAHKDAETPSGEKPEADERP